MRRLFLVVLLLALTGTTQAIDIKGKWGLGVGTGDRGLPSELWVTRGKTTRTAWLLYVDADQYHSVNKYRDGNETYSRSVGLTLGPGFRRYTRPQEKLSPYWDVNATFFGSRGSYSTDSPYYGYSTSVTKSARAGVDFAVGVEYFLPWHFSLAAHTSVLGVNFNRHWMSGQSTSGSRGWSEGFNMDISPRLHVRVYF